MARKYKPEGQHINAPLGKQIIIDTPYGQVKVTRIPKGKIAIKYPAQFAVEQKAVDKSSPQ